MKDVQRWTDKCATGPISYVFDAGVSRGQVDAIMAYALDRPEYNVAAYSFARPADLSPLQAADILAYETYKEVIAATTASGPSRRARRYPLKVMVGRITEIRCYDEKTFAPFKPEP